MISRFTKYINFVSLIFALFLMEYAVAYTSHEGKRQNNNYDHIAKRSIRHRNLNKYDSDHKSLNKVFVSDSESRTIIQGKKDLEVSTRLPLGKKSRTFSKAERKDNEKNNHLKEKVKDEELKVLFIAFDATVGHMKRFKNKGSEIQFSKTLKEHLVSDEFGESDNVELKDSDQIPWYKLLNDKSNMNDDDNDLDFEIESVHEEQFEADEKLDSKFDEIPLERTKSTIYKENSTNNMEILSKDKHNYSGVASDILSSNKLLGDDLPHIIFLSEFALDKQPPSKMDIHEVSYILGKQVGDIAVQKIACYYKEELEGKASCESLTRTGPAEEKWLKVTVGGYAISGVHLSSKYANPKFQKGAKHGQENHLSGLTQELGKFMNESGVHLAMGDFNANCDEMGKVKLELPKLSKKYEGKCGDIPFDHTDHTDIESDNHRSYVTAVQHKSSGNQKSEYMGAFYEANRRAKIPMPNEIRQLPRATEDLIFSDHNPVYIRIPYMRNDEQN